MITKAEFKALQEKTFLLACQIGLNPAARVLGLPCNRVRLWASRGKWNISKIHPTSNARPVPNVPSAQSVIGEVMAKLGDRAKIAMANVTAKAFEHADTLPDPSLLDKNSAIALQQHARTAQIAHMWFPQADKVNVAVQVNQPMPTAEERAELNAIDRKLDAIALRLKG